MADLAAKSLGVAHALVGISAVIAPVFTQAIFQLDPAPTSALIGRLFGSRDILMGAAIWMSRPGDERHRTLFIVNCINVIDVATSAVSLLEGNLSVQGTALAGGGAAVLLALGLLGMRSGRGPQLEEQPGMPDSR